MDLPGELGYGLKSAKSTVCAQCHGSKENKGFFELHEEHVTEKNIECSTCHTFSRPERGLGGYGGDEDD
jgi:mono/diheme cytochrome c family protein